MIFRLFSNLLPLFYFCVVSSLMNNHVLQPLNFGTFRTLVMHTPITWPPDTTWISWSLGFNKNNYRKFLQYEILYLIPDLHFFILEILLIKIKLSSFY